MVPGNDLWDLYERFAYCEEAPSNEEFGAVVDRYAALVTAGLRLSETLTALLRTVAAQTARKPTPAEWQSVALAHDAFDRALDAMKRVGD